MLTRTYFPGGKPINADNATWLAEQYGFPISDKPGLIAPEMMALADIFYYQGGFFLLVHRHDYFIIGILIF